MIATALSGCDKSAGELTGGPDTREAIEIWKAGGLQELGDVIFASLPSSGAVAPNGLAAVADPGRARILLLGVDGTLERELGGRGFAPGEFQRLNRVGFVGDSLLWATDNGSSWITWYDLRYPDSLWTVSRAEEHVPSTPWSARAAWVLADGSVLGEARGGESASGTGETPAIPIVKWSVEGELQVLDIVENVAPRSRNVRMENGLFMGTRQAIEGTPIVGMARGGEWFFVVDRTPASEETGRMLVTRYSFDGREIDRVEISYRASRVDEAALESLRRQAEAFEEQLPPRMGIEAEDVLEATWIPDRLPPARDVLADESGFWVLREMTSPGLWQRYDLDGELLFDTVLPNGFRGLAGDADGLLGWLPDSLTVPELRWYEIIPASQRRPASDTAVSHSPGRSLSLVRAWDLRDLPSPRSGLLARDGSVLVSSKEGGTYYALPSDSLLVPLPTVAGDAILAQSAPGVLDQHPLAITPGDGSVRQIAGVQGDALPIHRCSALRAVTSASRTVTSDRLLAVVQKPSTRGLAVRLVQLGGEGCEVLAESVIRCSYGSPTLAASNDSIWFTACPDPTSPLFRVVVSRDSIGIGAVSGSVPDMSRLPAYAAPPRPPRWAGLPLLKVEGGFLRVVSDLRSDTRRFEHWDEFGEHEETVVIHEPIGFSGSSPDGRYLLGLSGRSVVVYELTR
ncbi:MAG: hypothetical protein RQ745_11595 [Longimicrobiales bacterium]|nr:hypothetical protein [Longimicrobiales bacterium]